MGHRRGKQRPAKQQSNATGRCQKASSTPNGKVTRQPPVVQSVVSNEGGNVGKGRVGQPVGRWKVNCHPTRKCPLWGTRRVMRAWENVAAGATSPVQRWWGVVTCGMWWWYITQEVCFLLCVGHCPPPVKKRGRGVCTSGRGGLPEFSTSPLSTCLQVCCSLPLPPLKIDHTTQSMFVIYRSNYYYLGCPPTAYQAALPCHTSHHMSSCHETQDICLIYENESPCCLYTARSPVLPPMSSSYYLSHSPSHIVTSTRHASL